MEIRANMRRTHARPIGTIRIHVLVSLISRAIQLHSQGDIARGEHAARSNLKAGDHIDPAWRVLPHMRSIGAAKEP